jgi:hypothetical protein
VRDIIGSRDERAELDAEDYRDLKRLANRVLARKLTSEEEMILRRLCYGTGDAQPAQPRRARGRRPAHDDEPLRPEKPSVIARHLLAWRFNVTDPDVRRMQSHKCVAQDFTALVLKYGAEQPVLDADGKPVTDENGRPIQVQPPVCDNDGRPILWVPDEHGEPSRPYGVLDDHGRPRPFVVGEPLPRRPVKAVRPRVKMIFR